MIGQVSYVVEFKNLYSPDTLEITNVSEITLEAVIETGRPGKEITFCGGLKGLDTVGGWIQPFFFGEIDEYGAANFAAYYPDQNIFQITPSVAYAAAFDGIDRYYFAGASNNTQIIMCTDTLGKLHWSHAVNHHEFYSIWFAGHENILVLGQDESVVGSHDFSLIRIDSTGKILSGMMHGTEYFDQPDRLIPTDSGYVMGGWSHYNLIRHLCLIRVDENLDQIWAYAYGKGTENYLGIGVAESHDGSGYVMTGYKMRGPAGTFDSLLILKVDRAGNFKWCNRYFTDSTHMIPSAIGVDEESGDIFITGSFQGDSAMFRQPFVMKTDSAGNLLWAKDYGKGDSLTEEVLNDIILLKAESQFIAVGKYIGFDTTPVNLKSLVVKASRDSGETGCEKALALFAESDSLVATGTFFQESVDDTSVYPFYEGLVGFNHDVECSVMTKKDSLVLRIELTEKSAWWMENPASQTVTMGFSEIPDGQMITIEILDLLGKKLLTTVLSRKNGIGKVNLPQLSSGHYLVAASSKNVFFSRKILFLKQD